MEFITLLEMVGTMAFAVSGALKGIKKQLDYYGVAVFAMTTAVGGGIIRDVLINKYLPTALANPTYVIISLFSTLAAVAFYDKINPEGNALMVFDAIGLGAFTAIGAEAAVNSGLTQPFVIITLAILTGTGGGILRDVFAGEIPSVFQRGFYALACLLGAILFIILHGPFGSSIAMYAAFVLTLALRLVFMKRDIKLR